MTQPDDVNLAYYSAPGPMTHPGAHAAIFDVPPPSLPALVRVVQNMLLHMHWAEAYGVTLTDERREEASIRSVDGMVTCLLAMDDSALTEARPFEDRVVGTCRDYAVLLCSMLQHRGVPARARCGFGAYFLPGHHEDHWACEVWNPDTRPTTASTCRPNGTWVGLAESEAAYGRCTAIRSQRCS